MQNNEVLTEELKKLSPSEIQKAADSLISQQNLEQHTPVINHMSDKNNGNPLQFYASWTPMLWQSNSSSSSKDVIINGKPVPSYDMDYYIAESLHSLQSGQDPEAEYNGWVEDAKKIFHDMKNDGTTLSELHARDDFVLFLDDRETDLKRVIALYSGVAFNNNCPQQAQAQEKLKFLTFKLSELRKLRERVKNIKPTLPHRPEDRRELAQHSIHGSPAVDLEQYDTKYEEPEEITQMNNSAAAVALAAGITAIELHRLQYRQALQKNIANQIAENQIPMLPQNTGQRLLELSGRTMSSPISPKTRGFSASQYLQLTGRQTARAYD